MKRSICIEQSIESRLEDEVYNLGYDAGKGDQFVHMGAISIICAICGFIVGLAV